MVENFASGKAAAIAEEVVVNTLTGIVVLDVVPNVDSCNDNIKYYEHKIRTLISSYNQLAREAVELRKSIEETKREMSVNEQFNQGPDIKQVCIDIIVAQTKSLLEIEGVAQDKDDRIREAESNVEKWTGMLSQLKAKVGPVGKITKIVAKSITSAGTGLGTVGGEVVQGVAHAAEHTHEMIIEMGNVIVENVVEQGQNAKSKKSKSKK